MTIQQLKSLSEDELAILWGCVNVIEPKVLSTCDLDVQLFTSINHRKLMNRLLNCRIKIKQEYHSVFDGLLNKLKVP